MSYFVGTAVFVFGKVYVSGDLDDIIVGAPDISGGLDLDIRLVVAYIAEVTASFEYYRFLFAFDERHVRVDIVGATDNGQG